MLSKVSVCCAGCTLCALNEVEAAKQEFAAALAIMPRHLEVSHCNSNYKRHRRLPLVSCLCSVPRHFRLLSKY